MVVCFVVLVFGWGAGAGAQDAAEDAEPQTGQQDEAGQAGDDDVDQAASQPAGVSVDAASSALVSEQATEAERLESAELLVSLSQWGREDASAALVSALSAEGPVEVRRAVLEALAGAEGELPGDGVIDALVGLVRAPLGDLEADWARVLGRYELERVVDQLTAIARADEDDKQTTPEHKRLAIRALGEHRRLFAARALLGLANDESIDARLRVQAFDALGRLTHQPDLGDDERAWAAWYAEARRMNAAQWQRMLHENLLQLTRQRAAADARVRDRLTQSQRALYSATAAEQRPALLVEMLQDPLDGVRALALDLARQRAEDNGDFGPELRHQLRERLNDPLASVREASARLLGQLLDEQAAADMAQILTMDMEPRREVKRAFLTALSQMPRAEALAPAARLLNDPELRASAAGMLAAAHRAQLGEPAFWQRLRTDVKRALGGVQTPRPQLVTLLGLVIASDDKEGWSRLRGWLGSEDERVREAAARAWAASGRDLSVLAKRSEDVVIRPIALKAIAERAKDDQTLRAIAGRRPTEPEDVRMWDQALVALAGRVSPAAVLGSVQQLAGYEADTRQTREHMLTAAIDNAEALNPTAPIDPATDDNPEASDPADPTDPAADPPSRDALALLIARAQTRVLADAPALVVLDYEAALAHADQLDAELTDRARRGLVRAYLADRRIDDAFATAARLLKPDGELTPQAAEDPLIGEFIQSVRDATERGRKDDAIRLLAGLRTLLATAISAELDAELIKLKQAIETDAPPPADPAPDNEPADEPDEPEPADEPAEPAEPAEPEQPQPDAAAQPLNPA